MELIAILGRLAIMAITILFVLGMGYVLFMCIGLPLIHHIKVPFVRIFSEVRMQYLKTVLYMTRGQVKEYLLKEKKALHKAQISEVEKDLKKIKTVIASEEKELKEYIIHAREVEGASDEQLRELFRLVYKEKAFPGLSRKEILKKVSAPFQNCKPTG